MEVEADAPMVETLVASLEQATLMAKQITITTDPSRLFQIHAALNSAHHQLSRHLSQFPPPPMQHSQRLENSVSSAVGGGEEDGEIPMVTGDEDEEQNSRVATVDRVEEKLRECFIQNKRSKRQLSPSAELRRGFENEAVSAAAATELDPLRTKLRSLGLIYQFHA